MPNIIWNTSISSISFSILLFVLVLSGRSCCETCERSLSALGRLAWTHEASPYSVLNLEFIVSPASSYNEVCIRWVILWVFSQLCRELVYLQTSRTWHFRHWCGGLFAGTVSFRRSANSHCYLGLLFSSCFCACSSCLVAVFLFYLRSYLRSSSFFHKFWNHALCVGAKWQSRVHGICWYHGIVTFGYILFYLAPVHTIYGRTIRSHIPARLSSSCASRYLLSKRAILWGGDWILRIALSDQARKWALGLLLNLDSIL